MNMVDPNGHGLAVTMKSNRGIREVREKKTGHTAGRRGQVRGLFVVTFRWDDSRSSEMGSRPIVSCISRILRFSHLHRYGLGRRLNTFIFAGLMTMSTASIHAAPYDLVIRHGTIFDGSGKKPVIGD